MALVKRQDTETLQSWIDSVNAVTRKLTPWETKFMESISEQFEEKSWLSEGQEETLEKIYAQRT